MGVARLQPTLTEDSEQVQSEGQEETPGCDPHDRWPVDVQEGCRGRHLLPHAAENG